MAGKMIQKTVLTAMKYILLALFFLFTVFPFFWLLVSSLKGSKELYEFPVHYLPREASLNNYREVIEMGNFGLYILNSLFIALAGACLVVLIAGMSSYILSRMEFKSKPLIFMVFMMTQMLPTAVGFAPLIYPYVKDGDDQQAYHGNYYSGRRADSLRDDPVNRIYEGDSQSAGGSGAD